MFIIIILCVYAAMYVTYPVITILHELGHATAYLLLTKPDKIDIFIGSIRNTDTKIKFQVGKLHFFVQLSFLLAGGGRCKSSKAEANYIYKIIILLAGSLASLIVACIIGVFVFNSEINGMVKLYCFALIICSLISLFVSLKPRVDQKSGIGNDGKQLVFTFKYRKVYADYTHSTNLINSEDYKAAVEKLVTIVSLYPYEEKFLHLLVFSLFQIKDFRSAEKYLNDLKLCGELNIEEYLNLGYVQSLTGKHDLAVVNYRHALAIDKDNLIGLNNLGYELTLAGNYAKGQEVLEKAVKVNPEFAYPYSNLGFLNILKGDLETGKELIEKSIELEPDNAYAYKHLGVYYLKSLDKDQSISSFNKALELDNTINLEPYFQEAQSL